MAEVTMEMIYRIALDLKAQVESLAADVDDCGMQVAAIRTHMIDTHCDVRNVHAILVRQDAKLARIERRLGIGEMSA